MAQPPCCPIRTGVGREAGGLASQPYAHIQCLAEVQGSLQPFLRAGSKPDSPSEETGTR